ncbi:hypothetical protein LEP1GSC050_2809 [Leptospira broomii serovar Hurstbridge str. 5399]|uniref:Abasic site processing protein n=1 Tax=Leptospira broomii serovar Hurstbridge str. 5399 TaxID=1049789 RepID=T0FDE5_9LEPT|nr:SOS response-associated peptidase [Leptospira broomii]EQA45597.1 hypothetical protein LEP1GSC050_2809 [Leptospira broomii serovar Hurstbridge str. 5399]
MCSRIAQSNKWSKSKSFKFVKTINELKSRYNIALTEGAEIILKPGIDYTVEDAMFWLVNEQSRSLKEAFNYTTFNAKAETIFDLVSFKKQIYTQRCIVPVDAFYEAKGPKGQKQPYAIRMKDNAPFGMAGIYSRWHDPNTKDELISFAIITTVANELIAMYHDKKRMPVILPPESYEAWLDEKLTTKEHISSFFKTFPEEGMKVYPVSNRIFSTKNRIQGEGCLDEISLSENSSELF